MRVAVLSILLFALASAEQYPRYEEGKKYVYEYEGFVLSGLPETSELYSGLKVEAKPEFSVIEERRIMMTVRHPRIMTFNGTWPTQEFKDAPELTTTLGPAIETPVIFEYQKGLVGDIFAPASLPDAVVNIHRGIINIFNVNIGSKQNYFTVHEADIVGVCETAYTIVDLPEVVKVIKTKHYDQCLERPVISSNYIMANEYVMDNESPSLRSAAVFNYNMTEYGRGLIIQEAYVEGEHIYSPFAEQRGSAETFIRQRISFVDKASADSAPSTPMENRGSIVYKFPSEVPGEGYSEEMDTITLEEISGILDAIIGEMDFDTIAPTVPARWIQMTKYLRRASHPVLMAAWNKYSDKLNYRKFLIDTLPIVGTEAAVEALYDIIKAEPEIIREYAAYTFTALGNPIRPTEAYLMKIKEMIEDPIIGDVLETRRAAYLAYGAAIYSYCNNRTVCPEPLYEILERKYLSAPNNTEREIILKAMGNAGLVELVPFVRKLFKQPEELPVRIQVAAIQAMRKIAPRHPVHVRAFLLPIFLDPQFDPEVRITCCAILFETEPSVATILMIAQRLNTEPSNQVVSFVYSHINTMAESVAPIKRPVARACQMALRFARLRPGLVYRYSKAVHLSTYNENLKMGGFVDLQMMKNAKSFLPKELITKLNLHLAGYSVDVMDIGLRGEGLQKLFEDLSEPQSMWRKYKSLSDMLKKRRTPVSREESTDTYNVENRLYKYKAYEEEESDLLATMFIRLFGNELYVFYLDKESIMEIVKSGAIGLDVQKIEEKLREGLNFKWLKVMPMLGSTFRMPTIIGLPLYLDVESPWITTLKTEANVNIVRDPEEPFTRYSDEPSRRYGERGSKSREAGDWWSKEEAKSAEAGDWWSKEEAKSAEAGDWWSKEEAKSAEAGDWWSKEEAKSAEAGDWWSKETKPESSEEYYSDRRRANPKFHRNYATQPMRGIKTNTQLLFNNQLLLHVTMGVDAILIETGVGVTMRFHGMVPLAAGLNLDFEQREYYLDFQPVKKAITRADLSSEVFTYTKKPTEFIGKISVISPPKEPVEDGPRVVKTELCMPYMKETFGWQPCYIIEHVPMTGVADAVYFPLNGPLNFSEHWTPDADRPQKIQVYLKNRIPVTLESFRRGELDSVVEITTVGRQRESGLQFALTYDGKSERKVVELTAEVIREEYQKMRMTFSTEDVYRKGELLVGLGENFEQYVIQNKYRVESSPHISLNIESSINEIPEYLSRLPIPIDMFLEYYVYMTGIARVEMEENAPKTMEIDLRLPNPVTLDVAVKMPKVTLIREGMRLPYPIEYIPGPETYTYENMVKLAKEVIKDNMATCHVEGNQYVTFDNVTYQYQLPGECQHILAKDGAKHSKFMVLISKHPSEPEKKYITIHVSDRVVELYPDYTVKVDGQPISFYGSNKHQIPDVIAIYKTPEYISVECPVGVYVKYYGENVYVHVQPIYHARTVGLCGNDDDEQHGEYTLPDHTVVEDATVFAHAWILKGERCSDACKLAPRHKIINERVDGDDMKCFSTVPISHCVRGCEPTQTNTVKLGFHCMPADYQSAAYTEQMLNSNQMEELNLATKRVDMMRYVEADVACDCDRCVNLPGPRY